MHTPFIPKVKDCTSIYSDGNTVLLCGKYLWIYRADGTFVSKHRTIRNPYKVSFMPGNTALVDGSGSKSYYYITLDTGEILWSSNKKGHRTTSSFSFAVSPDGTTAFDVCIPKYGILQVDRLQPSVSHYDTYTIRDGLRVTDSEFCISPNELYILQSHLIINPNDPYSEKSLPVRQNGLMVLRYSEKGPQHCWERYWASDGTSRIRMRGCNRTHILFEDFTVLNMDTSEAFSLVSDLEKQRLPFAPFSWRYDPDRRLLFVYYTGLPLNLVIDCNEKKIVSNYLNGEGLDGFQGCLIDNEYWIGTGDGIVKYPFPHTERIPVNISRFGKI